MGEGGHTTRRRRSTPRSWHAGAWRSPGGAARHPRLERLAAGARGLALTSAPPRGRLRVLRSMNGEGDPGLDLRGRRAAQAKAPLGSRRTGLLGGDRARKDREVPPPPRARPGAPATAGEPAPHRHPVVSASLATRLPSGSTSYTRGGCTAPRPRCRVVAIMRSPRIGESARCRPSCMRRSGRVLSS
jgi:hypothetical protein